MVFKKVTHFSRCIYPETGKLDKKHVHVYFAFNNQIKNKSKNFWIMHTVGFMNEILWGRTFQKENLKMYCKQDTKNLWRISSLLLISS